MGISVEKSVCVYCKGDVEENYRHSTWKSKSECLRCGTKWEKQYDEYDLINMRIKRSFGSVFVMKNDEVIRVGSFRKRPTQEEVDELLNQMTSVRDQDDSCFVVFEEEGKWIKRFAGGDTEEII